jgi:iron complex transport system substrate-binding protein
MIRSWLCTAAFLTAFSSTTAVSQTRFVDDAKREVQLPARVSRVFAAGAPAEVLLYTLVPEMLVGRNRVPEGDAVQFFPPAYRTPVFIKQLPEVDNPAADAELLALKPDLYVDYGSVLDDYIAAIDAVQGRTRVPGIILDGTLTRIPETYRRLGAALGVTARGEQLAAAAERILSKYRGVLAQSSGAGVYLACSADGFVPCLEDDSAGEQLKWLGGINVAGTRATAPRRPLTIDEIRALSPRAIVVAGGAGAATRLRANGAWQSVDAVAAGRVYAYPALPFNWGPRPPSVNRLPGLVWLAYVVGGRALDAEFDRDIRSVFKDFYHLELTAPQLQKLVATQ